MFGRYIISRFSGCEFQTLPAVIYAVHEWININECTPNLQGGGARVTVEQRSVSKTLSITLQIVMWMFLPWGHLVYIHASLFPP